MLIFRIMALWILVILSPLAFISYVFPASKKFYEMWKNNFIQWCIIGAPAGLFYFIAAKMIEKGSGIPNPPAFNRSAIFAGQFGTASQSFFQSLTGMFSLFIPGIFLIIGFLFALKTSAMGADIITSRAGKAWSGLKNYASQATKTGAKYAGGKIAGATGVAGLYNRTRDKITQGTSGPGWRCT